jgi:hypothetical protein
MSLAPRRRLRLDVALVLVPLLGLAPTACSTTFGDDDATPAQASADGGERDASLRGGGATSPTGTTGATGTSGTTGPTGTTGTTGTTGPGDGTDDSGATNPGSDADAEAGSPPAGDGGVEGGGGGDASAVDAGRHDSGPSVEGPTIVAFAHPTFVNPDQGSALSLTATDSDGVGALTGAVVLDGPLGPQFAALTSVGPGSYTLTITWDMLNAAQAINISPGANPSIMRVLYLQVTDDKGRTAVEGFPLIMSCDNLPSPGDTAACNGVCLDLTDDPDNCGNCFIQCSATGGSACIKGECDGWRYTTSGTSCDTACTAATATCQSAEVIQSNGTPAPITCSDVVSPGGTTLDVRCFCVR